MAVGTSWIFIAAAVLIISGYLLIFVSIWREHRAVASPGLNGEDIPHLTSTIHSQNALIVQLEEELAVAKKGAPALKGIDYHEEAKVGFSRKSQANGVIILGMHRSGTSVLGGLMNKMGLKVGGPLIQPGKDNEKGFFERIDVVLQNDYMMKEQGIHYGFRTEAYDSQTALYHAIIGMRGGGTAHPSQSVGRPLHQGQQAKDAVIKSDFFNEGKRALNFLNDPNNYPWMLKDPRLCITIRTWLPLLNFVPAILFSYRHPMDVALSLHRRAQEHYRIGKGLRMWYVYNMRAIQSSNDLCRVVSSHRRVMESSLEELSRVRTELIDRCGVHVPREVTTKDIGEFIDPHLQHGHNTQTDNPCTHPEGQQHLLRILPPPAQWETKEAEHIALYREVMRVYCAMEDGSAFTETFKWDTSVRDT